VLLRLIAPWIKEESADRADRSMLLPKIPIPLIFIVSSIIYWPRPVSI
jgi:hypothetical protein